jgi:hypothetical protein
MDAVALWFTPADTDVSTCSGGSTIVTEPDADADGGLRLWFVVMDEGDCEDQGSSVNVRLEEPSGGLLDIEGNDANLTLRPHPTGDFEWVGLLWTNWCGETSQVKLEATREGSGMGTFAEDTPSCVDASQPSRLTGLDTPPADPWPADADPDQATPMPGMTSEPPVCDPTTLQLALLPMPSTGLSVALSANADGNADAELCSLDASDLTLTITDATGRPIAVEGNGVTFTLGTDDPLLLHSTGSDGLVWDNWCGEPGPFTITATIAGQTLTSEVANGPECTDEDQPSMIWGANNGRDVWKP